MLTTRLLLTCLGIAVLTTPALCAQFFIVQEPGTNRCTIAERPPAPDAGVIVGDGVVAPERPDTVTSFRELR
jgi:hypothetical protein